MLENKTAADFRTLKKNSWPLFKTQQWGHTAVNSAFTFSQAQTIYSIAPCTSPRGKAVEPPKQLFVRKKFPLIKVSLRIPLLSLSPVPISLEDVAVREVGPYWDKLGLPWKCNKPSPSAAGLKIQTFKTSGLVVHLKRFKRPF